MLFALLHEKLIAQVKDRIRSGEITERGLAKLTGLSQPHVHNVLKGVRSLSTESADLIGAHLGISISDLLEPGTPIRRTPGFTGTVAFPAPHLAGAAGPFREADVQSPPSGFRPLPSLAGVSVAEPVWVTLGDDPEIFPYFQNGDVVLVGRSSDALAVLDPDSVYLVNAPGGTLLRAIRLAATRLYLITPKTAQEPRLWTSLPLGGREPKEVIFGKVVWLDRQLRPNPFGIGQPTP